MLRWVSTAGIRSAIVLAVAVSLLLFPPGSPSRHDPPAVTQADAARHLLLSPAVCEDHDHVHDEGAARERQPGHKHGHNAADHSHESASPAVLRVMLSYPKTRQWQPHGLFSVRRAPTFRLERPPRPMAGA
jgi:hypothetical protein